MNIPNAQIKSSQEKMAPQSLVSNEWFYLGRNKLFEARMNADEYDNNISKLAEDDSKRKCPKLACRNVAPQLQKGAVEEHPNEIAFATETINDKKEEHRRSTRISIWIISVSHFEIDKNNLIRYFIYFYFNAY